MTHGIPGCVQGCANTKVSTRRFVQYVVPAAEFSVTTGSAPADRCVIRRGDIECYESFAGNGPRLQLKVGLAPHNGVRYSPAARRVAACSKKRRVLGHGLSEVKAHGRTVSL